MFAIGSAYSSTVLQPGTVLKVGKVARALVGDVLPLLEPALRHAGLSPAVLPLGDKKAATAMLRELPTLWAITELKRLQHENPARSWSPRIMVT